MIKEQVEGVGAASHDSREQQHCGDPIETYDWKLQLSQIQERRAALRERFGLPKSDASGISSQQRQQTSSIEDADEEQDNLIKSLLDHPGWARRHPLWNESSASDILESRRRAHDDRAEDNKEKILLGPAYIPAEETIRNDYSQCFVDSRGRLLPGSAVRNPALATRFEEYPKLRRLLDIKAQTLAQISHAPTYLCADLLPSLSSPAAENAFHLAGLAPVKYDVVVIDPPLEAYDWEDSIGRSGGNPGQAWSWDQIAALPIPQIVARESFVFLWVGAGTSDGLERGHEVLTRWGFRRCEDIVWVQTNHEGPNQRFRPTPSSSAFVSTTQHCLMGIRGTVRRSTDANFVHCNIDTDVILWEGESFGTEVLAGNDLPQIDKRSKPAELMEIAENFCLGTRRLELFGRNRNLRRGWLTIGLDVGPGKDHWSEAMAGKNSCAASGERSTPEAYEHARYTSHFVIDQPGCPLSRRGNLVPFNEEADDLRPKTPPKQPVAIPGRQQMIRPQMGPGPIAQQGHPLMNLPVSQGQLQTGSPFGVATNPSSYAVQSAEGDTVHYGAGLSGLGAGGPSVVSRQSGSEHLSGAQASVLLGNARESARHSPTRQQSSPQQTRRQVGPQHPQSRRLDVADDSSRTETPHGATTPSNAS